MPTIAPTHLKAYIRADYDAAASGWERFMSPVFRVPAERLVAHLAPRCGDRCLDLACGSALLARAFAARVDSALVRACDISPAQVAESRALLAGSGLGSIEVRVMDAERLRYPPASFERVGCGFGINHFPRPHAALRGAHRVLAPGGRAGFTVWGGKPNALRRRFDDRLLELLPALDETVGACEDTLSRVVIRNSNPSRLSALMERAGFVDVRVHTHRFATDDIDAPSFVDAMLARVARDVDRAGLDAPARRELREALVAEFAGLPRDAFIARRTYHAVTGSRPASQTPGHLSRAPRPAGPRTPDAVVHRERQ